MHHWQGQDSQSQLSCKPTSENVNTAINPAEYQLRLCFPNFYPQQNIFKVPNYSIKPLFTTSSSCDYIDTVPLQLSSYCEQPLNRRNEHAKQ
jgi:hypothetical protein